MAPLLPKPGRTPRLDRQTSPLRRQVRRPAHQVMQAHLARLGKDIGINFKYGGRTGNTRDSHRLVQLGKTKGEGVQTRVVEELFAAYFENEEDITDRETLVSRAVRAGLEEKEVREWMESGAGGEEVDREVLEAKKKFVTGVPNFTINGRFEIQGAGGAAGIPEGVWGDQRYRGFGEHGQEG